MSIKNKNMAILYTLVNKKTKIKTGLFLFDVLTMHLKKYILYLTIEGVIPRYFAKYVVITVLITRYIFKE